MKLQVYDDIYSEELAHGAIINDRHPGFKEDYMMLHCLLRKYKIKSCFEIGTHVGWGTQIIKNALGPDSEVYSLDLPDEESGKSEQHPTRNPNGTTGSKCTLPYTQLFGDSQNFDYEKYPVDAYYIDAEHSYVNVFVESTMVAMMKPKIVIYHDADSKNVCDAAVDVFEEKEDYVLVRIVGTRILYALKIENNANA